jgi:hypothetical protein
LLPCFAVSVYVRVIALSQENMVMVSEVTLEKTPNLDYITMVLLTC